MSPFHHALSHFLQHLDLQISARDLDSSVGREGRSLLPFTRHLPRAQALHLMSLNPQRPCKVAGMTSITKPSEETWKR